MNSTNTENDWGSWLAENAGRFLLFARQQTRCGHDAEDVLQEALVESWQRAGGRPDPALVYATIRRRAISLGRSTDRRAVRELAAADGEESWFESNIEARETSALLEMAVRELPAEQRNVVMLKIWGELTFSEIARALGIPPGTAASRYRIAVDHLRQTILPSMV